VVDAALASPAKRAKETVTALEHGYGPLETVYETGIYNAPVTRLLDIVGNADDSTERLIIVGHNPGFEELVRHLADEWLAEGLPTAGLVAIELPADRWSDVRQRTGRISALIVPRDLRD
jgi:phosphohistidine phosphatase